MHPNKIYLCEDEMKRLIFLLCLVTVLCLSVVSLFGIQVRDIVVNKDDEGNPDGSFRVRFIHPVGTEETFYWYFCYQNKRVSDHFQSTTPTHTSGFFEYKFIWQDVVPAGAERYVTVKFGLEPEENDEVLNGYDDEDVDLEE